MAIPVLKLNLAPEPSLWRQNHEALGWGAVGLGALLLLGTTSFAGWKYFQASREAKRTFMLATEARKVAREQGQLVAQLREVDVSAEMPRWKLAERILMERSLPWSRLTAELERSLVVDVRVKSLQRTRGTDQSVQLAIKGEARSREAEVRFIERLQANRTFAQVLLEREAERQGGGLEFELKLPAAATPEPYTPLPEPDYSSGVAPAPVAAPRPAPAPRAAAPPPAADPVRRRPAEAPRPVDPDAGQEGPPQSGVTVRPAQPPTAPPMTRGRRNAP
jgi:hypothetical protein